MGFRKRNAKKSDNKSKSAVIMGKPASKLTKEEKKILSARMAEIKKENGSNATVQNTIPFLCMYRDGVCQVSENFFSLTVQFYDANYSIAEFDEQNNIFSKYCDVINLFDNTIKFQLTFENQNRSKEKLIKTVQIPEQEDDFNAIRQEYSKMLTDKLLKGSNGQSARKFLTFGIESTSYKAARAKLMSIKNDVIRGFKAFGVEAEMLDGRQRLEQIGDDFMKLYPSANILVATKKDFQKANRQQLFAKIATGNYDAVIIGHSQLSMIPVSKERQVMTIQSQIDDILQGIDELKKKDGSKFQIKAMERSRKSLQKQLDRLEKANQDDTLTFEQLGVDKLFVDEMQEFKNLFTPSKLQNIAGISNSASQKALDLFLKVRYLDEKTGGRGFVAATGTPLSNSVTELHTMMRFLEYDFLKDHGLQHFDNFISVFGEQRTDWELAPAGNRFKERTRIATFSGLPELMSMFKQVADIRTADTLKLDVPECEYKVVQVEATPFQQELVQELADRADAINAGNVDPTIDNMLRITSDGRKLGLDPRLIDPSFEDDPSTKLNQCVENVARIYAETAEDRLTQIIFCDLGVPHKSSSEVEVEGEDADDAADKKTAAERESLEEECDFCVYSDIKEKLIARGIPAEEIAFIHDAKTEKQKAELFEKVRNGEVRCLLGSTSKMGTGTNVQKRLIAVHDLDIPWRPSDLEQRAGRIIRQGNENKNVQIYRYVTKGTFDAYSYQTLENKQKFISQIMTSKTPARRCEDVDQQALTYSEIKALCTGDERIKEKLMLENEVKELRVLAAEHNNTVYEMQDKIARFPEQEKRLTTLLDNLHTDREALRKLPIDPERKLPVFKITIGDVEYTDRKEAAKALEAAAMDIKYADTPVKVGSFQGFDLKITMNSSSMGGGMTATMQGAAAHSTKLIESFAHNLNRIESALYNIDGRIEGVKENLAKLRLDHAEAQKIVSEPFPQQAELESKEERLKTLTDELNKAAAEAKRNAPKREKTCYFERAKMKRDAMRIAKKPKTPKDKAKGHDKKKPGIE